MYHCRFALYDYTGNPTAHYLVERKEVREEANTVAPEVTHHIFLVDRSGSMYSDMDAMKTMLEKLLTLAEYKDSTMRATLISYSSQGDYTVHFHRKTVEQIMAPGSAEVEAIRQLRVTGLTCMSQALEATKDYISPGETTGISLHSDGYANDRSPTAERREIDRICEQLKGLPNVFVNTIAYRSSSDFKLLASIANAMSGKCVQAGSVKEVFDALHDTSSLLSGKMSPAIGVQLDGADYFTFVSHAAQRVNGSAYDTILMGLTPNDDKTVFWFRKVSENEWLDSGAPVAQSGELLEPVYAFTMAKLAEGQLNTAKFALMSTRDAEMIPRHYRALTAPALAALYADIQSVLFWGKKTLREQMPQYGLGLHRIPLIHLLSTLDEFKDDVRIDIHDLAHGYQRQGIARAKGVRNDKGVLERREIESRIKPGWDPNVARCGGFELNNATASINVLCIQPIQIYRPAESDEAILEVAGVSLEDLAAFRNYTIVSDGALNVDHLRIQISNKRVHRRLLENGVLRDSSNGSIETYDPKTWYTVGLDDLPLVDFTKPFELDELEGVMVQLAQMKSLISLLTALLQGRSDRFTPEQIEALKAHDISKSLYYSPPTTNPYTDKTEALNQGQIDHRVSFQIDLGSTNPEILSRSQLHSGNQMLDRFYTVTIDGEVQKKPNWTMWWNPGATFGPKTLSSRTKITPIDSLMKPIYDAFLGFYSPLGVTTPLTNLLLGAGFTTNEASDFLNALAARAPRSPHDEMVVEVFTDTLKKLQKASDQLFAVYVQPLVFYIGATGLLPDNFRATALTAEQIGERYPDLKIGKNEQEGTFFAFRNGVLISVYAKSVAFSVYTP